MNDETLLADCRSLVAHRFRELDFDAHMAELLASVAVGTLWHVGALIVPAEKSE